MTGKERAPRNRTLQLMEPERKEFFSRCLIPGKSALTLPEITCRTLCGDFFKSAALLPRGFADLIIADPPYNLTKSFNGKLFSRKSAAAYEKYTRQWLELTAPLLKPGGSIYVCCDWSTSLIVGRVLAEFFTLRNRITWQREKGRGAAANWKNSAEDIFFATAGNEYTFNLNAVKMRRRVIAPYRDNGCPKDWVEDSDGRFRDSCPGNFWDDITVPFWSMPENTDHPTQKPEKLLAKLILASSNEHDMIFDPFLGSGSTSVTAKKLNRRYCGVEMDEYYCACAEKRLALADEEKSIQGFDGKVFYERNTIPGKMP
ncbi:MAG: site-specific DNA-methyltransferase [Lentisphaerae bacterium]|nr:site-specific DNA-methyltransferase [Lentisphaerota bacterium]